MCNLLKLIPFISSQTTAPKSLSTCSTSFTVYHAVCDSTKNALMQALGKVYLIRSHSSACTLPYSIDNKAMFIPSPEKIRNKDIITLLSLQRIWHTFFGVFKHPLSFWHPYQMKVNSNIFRTNLLYINSNH